MALVVLLASRVDADEPTRPPPPSWDPLTRTVFVGDDRVVHVFQPEFRPASVLLSELLEWTKGRAAYANNVLSTQLVLPRVVPLPAAPNKAPGPPVYSRILLRGPAKQLEEARNVLARFDAPTRSVSVSVLMSEVRASQSRSSGATFLYDKNGIADPGSTLYRGTALDFDPDAYLISTVTGVRPFEGTTLTFGDANTLGGSWEWTLRMLAKRGEAHFLGWPNLLCVEGQVGEMTATEALAQPLVRTDGTTPQVTAGPSEKVGVRLKVTPVRIGDDHAVLDLDLWLRVPEPSEEPSAPVSSFNLRERQVTTRVTVRDREPLLIGGLHLRRKSRSRRGIPRLDGLTLVDALMSARDHDCVDTELLFLVRATIVTPRLDRGLTSLSDGRPLAKEPAPVDSCCAEPVSAVEQVDRGAHDPWSESWKASAKRPARTSADLPHPPAVGRSKRR